MGSRSVHAQSKWMEWCHLLCCLLRRLAQKCVGVVADGNCDSDCNTPACRYDHQDCKTEQFVSGGDENYATAGGMAFVPVVQV